MSSTALSGSLQPTQATPPGASRDLLGGLRQPAWTSTSRLESCESESVHPEAFVSAYSVAVMGGDVPEEFVEAGAQIPWGIALYYFFQLLVGVVMMNMLIAIMGDTFERASIA